MLKYSFFAAFPVTNVPRSEANGGDFACVVFVGALIFLAIYVIVQWWESYK